MDSFSKAFDLFRARPWHALGLAAVFAASITVLAFLVMLLAAFLVTGEASSFMSSAQNNFSFGNIGGIGQSIIDLIQKLLLALLIAGLLGFVGSAYLFAGAAGTLAAALPRRSLYVTIEGYIAEANRNFGRVLVLWILYALAIVAYWLIVFFVAWVLREAGLLLGFWLFAAFVVMVIFCMPLLSLANASAVLERCNGASALAAGWRVATHHLGPVLGIGAILAVVGLVLGIISGELSRPFGTLGSIASVWLWAVLSLFGQLVWLHLYAAAEPTPAFDGVRGPDPIEPRTVGLMPSGMRVGTGLVGIIDRGQRLADVKVAPGSAVVIGRDPEATISVSDPVVSRRHASLSLEANGWNVTDLGSTNPTRVLHSDGSERTLRGSTRLAAGQLLIGQSIFTLYPVAER